MPSASRRSSGSRERLALACAVLAGVLFAVTQALAIAPYASADEAAHVDYAFQVWHGRLPVFEHGPAFRPPHGFVPPVQWVAQHPPLYYLLTAPVVGPLIDAGLPDAAAYAARGLNVVLYAALVVAAWWTARLVSRPGSPLPAATALVVGCTAWAARLGGSAYNDMLAALLVTVLLGLTLRSLRDGLDARAVTGLSTAAAACALTRASVLLLAVVCVGFAVAGALVRDGRRAWRRGAALALVATVTVLATSGWFYARNVRLTGGLTGARSDWAQENLGRSTRTLWGAASDLGIWGQLLDVFRWGGLLPQGAAATALLVLPTVGAVVVHRRRARRASSGASPVRLPARTALSAAAGPLLLGTVALVGMSVQLGYTMAGGSAHSRYLLPVLVSLCVPVAACLAAGPRTALPLWVGVVAADFAAWLLVGPPAHGGAAQVPVGAITAGAAAVVLAAAGAVLTARLARYGAGPRASARRTPDGGGPDLAAGRAGLPLEAP